MRGDKPIRRIRQVEARRAPVKASRMGKGTTDRLGRVLEEWLAEARIRYTYAGE